jgi:hypothetical protein
VTHAFQGFALAEYVARYGLHDVDASMEALAGKGRMANSAEPWRVRSASASMDASTSWSP